MRVHQWKVRPARSRNSLCLLQQVRLIIGSMPVVVYGAVEHDRRIWLSGYRAQRVMMTFCTAAFRDCHVLLSGVATHKPQGWPHDYVASMACCSVQPVSSAGRWEEWLGPQVCIDVVTCGAWQTGGWMVGVSDEMLLLTTQVRCNEAFAQHAPL